MERQGRLVKFTTQDGVIIGAAGLVITVIAFIANEQNKAKASAASTNATAATKTRGGHGEGRHK